MAFEKFEVSIKNRTILSFEKQNGVSSDDEKIAKNYPIDVDGEFGVVSANADVERLALLDRQLLTELLAPRGLVECVEDQLQIQNLHNFTFFRIFNFVSFTIQLFLSF